jgi:hypothetical protein
MGIETATFQLIAHCLNKIRYRVPPIHVFILHYYPPIIRDGAVVQN